MAARVIQTVEELKRFEGREVGVSDWLQVTQSRIDQFAGVTEDRQWIHVDPERAAKESPYGTTIAHGFLSLSLVSLLWHQSVVLRGDFQRLINYGLNRVRFPAPVPVDSRIRGRFDLQGVREFAGGIQIALKATIEREGGTKPCLVAEWLLRAYR